MADEQAQPVAPTIVHVVQSVHWYQKRWVKLVAVFLVLVVITMSITNLSLNAVYQKSNASHIEADMAAMNASITTNLNNITASIISDRDRITVIEQRLGITPPPTTSSFIGGREKLTSPSYIQELNLFKSLSPAEQAEYLNLPKADKITKYGSVFN